MLTDFHNGIFLTNFTSEKRMKLKKFWTSNWATHVSNYRSFHFSTRVNAVFWIQTNMIRTLSNFSCRNSQTHHTAHNFVTSASFVIILDPVSSLRKTINRTRMFARSSRYCAVKNKVRIYSLFISFSRPSRCLSVLSLAFKYFREFPNFIAVALKTTRGFWTSVIPPLSRVFTSCALAGFAIFCSM